MWNCPTYMKFMFNIVFGFPPIYLSLMFVCLFFSLYLCLFVQSLSDQKENKEREKKTHTQIQASNDHSTKRRARENRLDRRQH